jgi:hypothetical protein
MKARHPLWDLSFDPVIMMSVSASAMDDIWRWKLYHLRASGGTVLSDAVKRATFFTKWIVKFRPIYFVNRSVVAGDFVSSFDKGDSTLLINEHFAIHVSLATLAIKAGKPNIILQAETMAAFLYDPHYRNINADALMIWYRLLAMIAEQKKIILK